MCSKVSTKFTIVPDIYLNKVPANENVNLHYLKVVINLMYDLSKRSNF